MHQPGPSSQELAGPARLSQIRQVVKRVVSIALGAVALTCVSCGHPAARRLQGEWVGEGVENVELNQLAVATGWARGLRFVFDGARATVTIPTELPRSGPFKVTNASERSVTIAIERPDHAEDVATFALDTASTMRWQLGEGRSVLFRRVE